MARLIQSNNLDVIFFWLHLFLQGSFRAIVKRVISTPKKSTPSTYFGETHQNKILPKKCLPCPKKGVPISHSCWRRWCWCQRNNHMPLRRRNMIPFLAHSPRPTPQEKIYNMMYVYNIMYVYHIMYNTMCIYIYKIIIYIVYIQYYVHVRYYIYI